MTQRKFDVVALGELLIDFTENGASGQGNALFEARPFFEVRTLLASWVPDWLAPGSTPAKDMIDPRWRNGSRPRSPL